MGVKCFLVVFLQLMPSAFGFIVTTPEYAVVGIVGGQAVLDCQLVPAEPPEDIEVRWVRAELRDPVHLYREGKDQPGSQDPKYVHRTELYKAKFRNGNVSLLIKQLNVQDEGVYKCQVASGNDKSFDKVTLKVAAVGLNPVIHLTSHSGSQVELECTSRGWYPEPRVSWLGAGDRVLPGTEAQPEGRRTEFYDVHSRALVSRGSQNTFTCRIRNELLHSTKGVTVQIAGQFFPSVSGWLTAFWIVFVLLLSVLLYAAYVHWRLRRLTQDNRILRMRPEVKEFEDLQNKLEKERADGDQERQKLRGQIDSEREEALKEQSRLQHIIDWDQMVRREVNVTLDPESANCQVLLSEDLKGVSDAGSSLELEDNPRRFERYPLVAGAVGYTSGRQYWEVDVGSCPNWDLGVVSGKADRKGRMALDETGGYWAIGCYWEKFEAKDARRALIPVGGKPDRIGLCLDLDAGLLSFFDPGRKLLLHSCRVPADQEGFYPVFCPWRSTEPLTIVPARTD